jgi:hypothetical protein
MFAGGKNRPKTTNAFFVGFPPSAIVSFLVFLNKKNRYNGFLLMILNGDLLVS